MNGKAILGVAAAVVSVAGGLAFKASHTFKLVKVYGHTAAGNICKQCKSLWTSVNGGGGPDIKCKTLGGVYTLHGAGSGSARIWFTKTSSNHACVGSGTSWVTVTH